MQVWLAVKETACWYMAVNGQLWRAWVWDAGTLQPTKLHQEGFRWELVAENESAPD